LHSIISRRLVAVGITAAAVAVAGAPSAQAVSKFEKKQSSAIKKAASSGKKASSKAGAASLAADKAAAAATDALNAAATADKKGSDAGTAAAGVKATVDAILAQVPTITGALQKLADGLTAAGAGLTTLGNAAKAQEYGVVKLQVGGTDVPGAILNSSDIPDDANGATVTGTFLASIPNGASNVPITLRAGIRGAESDGTGPALPAGAAGLVTMNVTNSAGTPAITLGGGYAGVPAAVPLTSAANAANGGAPVYDIPDEVGRPSATDSPFSFPTDKSIDLTAASTLFDIDGAGPSTPAPYTISNAAPVTSPNGSIPFTVTFTVRFHDLQASATDVTA
jgi:hypothetical protein